MATEPFQIEYAGEAADDLRRTRPFEPFWSQFRLRVDDFRVYYDVDLKKRMVTILRVLEKGQKQTPKEIKK